MKEKTLKTKKHIEKNIKKDIKTKIKKLKKYFI